MAFYFFPAFAQAERRKDFCSYGSLSTYVLIVSFFPFLSISCHLRGSLVSLLHTPTHPPCLYLAFILRLSLLCGFCVFLYLFIIAIYTGAPN